MLSPLVLNYMVPQTCICCYAQKLLCGRAQKPGQGVRGSADESIDGYVEHVLVDFMVGRGAEGAAADAVIKNTAMKHPDVVELVVGNGQGFGRHHVKLGTQLDA